jgi:uncharacterized protein (DUF934 family)
MKIISNDQASGGWQRLEAGGGAARPAADGGVLATLAAWRGQRERLLAGGARLGVELGAQDDPAALADDLAHLALIAIRFPAATDGRGLSIARLLRERLGYRAELRAVGEIAPDQVWFLARCGFDSAELRPGADAKAALASLGQLPALGANPADRAQRVLRRRAAP